MSGAIPKARTGVPGLDDILLGGLAVGRIFLLEGSPGTGKTTMALSFLLQGAAAGERNHALGNRARVAGGSRVARLETG
jgi:circadian clock protein KaiC